MNTKLLFSHSEMITIIEMKRFVASSFAVCLLMNNVELCRVELSAKECKGNMVIERRSLVNN